MSSFSLPLTNITLHLKQLNVDELNELGRASLDAAFTGLMGLKDFPASKIEKYLKKLRKKTGITKQLFDASSYRRFAGDNTLPRGHYYTVAFSGHGNDGGTLVRELRAYYNPLNAGIVKIFDSTDPNDRRSIGQFSPPEPGIDLVFLPVRSCPNPFATNHLQGIQPMLVHLPLKLITQQWQDILDLRNPITANTFAKALGEIEWKIDGKKVKAISLIPTPKSFKQVLPALLEQSLGGNSFTNMVA